LFLNNYRWFDLLFVFVAALVVTLSKAGILTALLACGILLLHRYGKKLLLGGLLGLAGLFPTEWAWDMVQQVLWSVHDRLPIWATSLKMLVHPFTGLGLGSFGFYYQQVRTENYTAGWFAHNDPLQFAVEMGIPAALVFVGLIATVALTTRTRNIAPACAMLAVFLMSLVEFQFYLPVISLLMGLALAFHIHGIPKPKQRKWIDE
jgi:O-antigen ligase